MKMSSCERIVEVRVLTDKPIKIPVQENTVVEDVCTEVAKILGIGPICRHLFSLRLRDTNTWLFPSYRMQEFRSDCVFDYRIRFKVPKLSRLKQTDLQAFNYYYHQVRKDVINNNVDDLNIEKHKGELLGLGVTDMYRVFIDEGVPLDQVEADYKKYIPKALLKNHFFFIKPKIHSSLSKIKIKKEQNGWYVKEEYLTMFDKIAPQYLTENYTAKIFHNGSERQVYVQVNPFHESQPGVSYRFDPKEDWQHLCTIDDLCYISVRKEGTVEISRKNGIPFYFSFNSKLTMYSFVSLLDGYYRLICKWTFNLCTDVFTPSLKVLHALKCHGPVGGQFSYSKLEQKRNNKPGSFILRESEINNDTYYLDVCTRDVSKPRTYKIEKVKNGDYLFSYDGKHYSSISELISAYRKSDSSLELLECIPPSEYDRSRLLMCAQDDMKIHKNPVSNPEDCFVTSSPQIINIKHLQVYKGVKKESKSGIMDHYRSIWNNQKDGRVAASMKVLKPEHKDTYLNEFLELVGSWATLQSNTVVKLFGVTLKGPVSMVTEYLNAGPFDVYLRENKSQMKRVDLVEAGSCLASALWHLEEYGITHGNIRCRKLLVSVHEENMCLVKLCDPGLHKYTSDEVPWIAPECYDDFKLTKKLSTADVWAFGTTLWEIFSFGARPYSPEYLEKEFYLYGRRLPLPAGCLIEIYNLMLECWDCDVFRRKKPQAIMRDIKQILYQVFNSRRTHSYATAFPKARGDDHACTIESNTSLRSDATAETLLATDIPSGDLIPVSDPRPDFNALRQRLTVENFFWKGSDNAYSVQTLSPSISAMLYHSETSISSSLDTDPNIQSIFELDKDCNVVLQGKIGQGFYGEVFKGYLERADREPQPVAVKKLKSNALSTTRLDLEREIAIMENLKHRNIVEIIGAIHEPDISLVMEFVRYGSLETYLKVNKETLKTETLLKFALDVACGMDYLGKKNIVHRDLAARNILVASENHVKISDFGLARFVGQNNYYILKTNRELPIKWYAPESLKDGRFSHLSDVWSYGVTLFEMFSLGEDPKLQCCTNDMDQSQLLSALESGSHLPCPATCPQPIYVKLILPCWKLESSERPTFSKICETIQKIRLTQS
ncbi:UNVERIFIED_CONTAM: hypothetical protein PYX00_000731 [Menopon gallinae]|uniref:Tyrosine-protein kinase n=1 Tax=Menopon gallinae TaxID=328185 RepID=A0AAW2IB51_9NEOP